ncbi:MAG: bifunctional heptose 7-phosphate kinase/heptose 1-phosphate adenyltransferase [Gemmataceae bacterium]
MTLDELNHLLAALPAARIALVGDLFLDRYLHISGSLDETSIETNLTAYQVTGVRADPGALGTVLNNLVALGVGTIHLFTFRGDDGEGYELQKALAARPGVKMAGVQVRADRLTPTYTKPLRDGVELNRLDIKNRTSTAAEIGQVLLQQLESVLTEVDAVLVLDQVSEAECGVVTEHLLCELPRLVARYPRVRWLADSRERIGLFRNCAIKPNQTEAARALRGVGAVPMATDFVELARRVNGTLFGTCGAAGMELIQDNTPRFLPAWPVLGPTDTCGAGDSCSAGILAAWAAGWPDAEAAAFRNLVAAITVTKIGTTGTASPNELRHRLKA